MSNFGQAVSGAFDTLLSAAGTTVVYQRGTAWVSVGAVPGRTNFEVDDGNGVVVEYRARDYLVRACDLVLNGVQVEPDRGDLIKETVGTKQRIYEVKRPDGSEQVWRYSDHDQLVMRIHAKLKETVNL